MRELRSALVALLAATVVCGLAYPLVMAGAAAVVPDGRPPIGTRQPKDLFQTRPSVTGNAPDATFFNNQGPNQRALADQIRTWVRQYRRREHYAGPIPADAVTSSASGVDPDISRANALIQARRVAATTGVPEARLRALIDANARHGDAIDVPALNDDVEAAR